MVCTHHLIMMVWFKSEISCAADIQSPLCLLSTVVNCGTLTNPANGRVSHAAGTTFGLIATYTCNTGYTRVGSSTRTCQSTGLWSGSAPACQGRIFVFRSVPVSSTMSCALSQQCSPPAVRIISN